MDKSVLESFVNTIKSADVENYTLRFEGGNRTISSKTDSSRLFIGPDCVYGIETNNNYGSKKGQFNIKAIPFEDIDSAAAYELTTKQTLQIAQAIGMLDDDVKEFISLNGNRVSTADPKNRANYGEEIDPKTGQPKLDDIVPARITYYNP